MLIKSIAHKRKVATTMTSVLKLTIIFLSILSVPKVNYAQKSVTFPNISSIVDTANLRLKSGHHKIIVRYKNGTRITYDTISLQVLPDSSKIAVNILPTANAGNDTTFILGKTGILKGSGKDVDGTIVKWYWRKVSGPRTGKISWSGRQNTTLTGLVLGTYIYELTVTDDKGGSGKDTVIVKVNNFIYKRLKQ